MKRKILAILSIAVAVLAIFAVANITNGFGLGNAGTVYTISNAASNKVLYYSRASDGSLTFGGSVSTGGSGTGAALASQGAVVLTNGGSFLLVVDAGSNQISVFNVLSSGVPVFNSITGSQGTTPISLTVYNNWVYVLNAGATPNISGFTLSNTGKLTYIDSQPLSGLALNLPEQIGFSPDGKVLVVTEKGSNSIDTYTVGYNGLASSPTTYTSVGNGPYGFAFTGEDNLVISEAAGSAGTAGLSPDDGTLSSYVISDQGTLRTISGAMPTFGAAPCWVAIDGEGSFAYTSNAHGGTISIFAISPSGGLNLISSIAAKTNIPCLDLAFSKNSQFLYALNGGYITGFQVYPDGSLSQVTTVNTNTGISPSATGLAAT
ncbi:MAG: lactonase family protein [Candidatus Bathyarchaeia archaeon]